MRRNPFLSKIIARVPARKSLAGSLRVLTGAVFTVIVVGLVVAYTSFSNTVSYADREGSSTNYGTTLASLLARPISLGDYATVEQSLHDSVLSPFICSIRVVDSGGKTIASVGNAVSKLCKKPRTLIERAFAIRPAAGMLDPRGVEAQGRVVLSVETDDLRLLSWESIAAALMAGMLTLMALLFINSIAVRRHAGAVRAPNGAAASSKNLGAALEGETLSGPLAAAPREIQPLLEKLTSLYRAYAKAEGDIRAGKVARQVAHDIRSPLAALEMPCTSKNVPEAERIIIRQATHRIRDIANDLSGRFREAPATGTAPADPAAAPAPQLLPVLIDEIVTEMRLHYRQRGHLEITANLDESNYGLFAAVDPSIFRRVLSNLIQNAVEAIPESGTVTIRSEVSGGKAVIAISDTGQGIPADILPRLGEHGATFGKPKGSGLGLHHAKEMTSLWNGGLDIESAPGNGTTVRLTLPVAEAPAWFVPRIELETGSHLVVLDDDQSIHRIWSERLSAWTDRGALKVFHFTSAQELRAWFTKSPDLARQARYLVDFELIGEEETGLALVKALGIQTRTVLVTSRYDEHEVRGPCEKDRIRLIPKGLAVFVPVHVEERKVRVVLIDDDRLTHRTWNHVAALAGQRILTVENLAGLDGQSIATDTPIYVDRQLADEARGEDVLRALHARGFTRLYLFTGETISDAEREEVGFVSGIVGKTIPPEVYGRA